MQDSSRGPGTIPEKGNKLYCYVYMLRTGLSMSSLTLSMRASWRTLDVDGRVLLELALFVSRGVIQIQMADSNN